MDNADTIFQLQFVFMDNWLRKLYVLIASQKDGRFIFDHNLLDYIVLVVDP